ncbi:hypothetical protein O6H91_13G062500 [Diphasiastrum complanatum]|uniref:Uncharacterized protein n=1 Tax=Diphasiastrum complanatum TaxID=34168 RepID=A0ACC2BVD1_DIPCM|nr:hypothetical protein O6H91_13G062500 [Diphasiastrum complanatum]
MSMDTRGSGGLELLLLFILFVSGALNVCAEVVVLTDASFSDKVKEPDTTWFIEFFAPWCGHCKRLAPIWEELGKAIEADDGVEIGQVDCTTNKPTCEKAGVRSYPTLKLFYNGEEQKKYSGPRDVESLKAFAVEGAAEFAKGIFKEPEALNKQS